MFDFTSLNKITSELNNAIKKSVALNPDLKEYTYEMWFKDMSVEKMTDAIIFISVTNEVQKITIEKKYKNLITEAVKQIYELDLKAVVIYATESGKVTKEMTDADEKKILLEDIDEETISSYTVKHHKPAANFSVNNTTIDREAERELIINLKDHYTFDNFIVGSSNILAYKTATMVAEHPSGKHNPFFIYGPSGLGKTHLLCAISNEYAKKFKHTRVIYVNGEDFTNELIDFIAEKNQINKKKAQIFREKYRNCDMLLIDDIQFIANKEATQNEIFHTFNALYEAGKQIIFASDRPPKDIQPLEERLTTRFESGVIVDIQPPDLELRTAILKRKAADMGIAITNDVLFFLAENISSNIRQLEGAIKKLNAYSYLQNTKITLELAKASIADILSGTEPINVTVEKVLSAVSQTFGIPQQELKSKKRTKEIVLARHTAIYIIREITDLSLQAIGKIFKCDHTTVLSAISKIEEVLETNTILYAQINDISNQAKG